MKQKPEKYTQAKRDVNANPTPQNIKTFKKQYGKKLVKRIDKRTAKGTHDEKHAISMRVAKNKLSYEKPSTGVKEKIIGPVMTFAFETAAEQSDLEHAYRQFKEGLRKADVANAKRAEKKRKRKFMKGKNMVIRLQQRSLTGK